MFVIMIPIDDLDKIKLFGDVNISDHNLIENLTEFYRYGPYKPKGVVFYIK